MMTIHKLALRLLLPALLLCTAPAHATVLEAYSFEQLVHASRLIVQARIIDRYSEATEQGIHTYVTLQVEDVITDRSGALTQETLTLSFLGGEANGETLQVAGQFIPAVGERALLFIADPATPAINPLTGWFQGYFPILEDAAGAYLDLRERPDLILANLNPDPLLKKMLALGADDAQLRSRFPDYARFRLDDFVTAIRSEAAAP
ncbi:MAG TPA: hypothetical protein VNR18_12960 [Hyphomicrobiales bacterium]|nr:hypothetical protein [Hyphomicrobiales bacterium]